MLELTLTDCVFVVTQRQVPPQQRGTVHLMQPAIRSVVCVCYICQMRDKFLPTAGKYASCANNCTRSRSCLCASSCLCCTSSCLCMPVPAAASVRAAECACNSSAKMCIAITKEATNKLRGCAKDTAREAAPTRLCDISRSLIKEVLGATDTPVVSSPLVPSAAY